MAFTQVLVTSLALWGGPGPASAPYFETASVSDTVSVSVSDTAAVTASLSASDTVSVSVSESVGLLAFDLNADRTELWPYGGPGPLHTYADKTVVALLDLIVSDTLSVQIVEEPVDENFIETADNLRIALGETASLLNHLAAEDTLLVLVSENIALLQSGVTLKTASDTLSVTLTEETAISVTVAVTDTVSVTFSDETATVATSVEAIAVTDTLSVSVSDEALLGIFAGVNPLSVNDTLTVALSESSSVLARTPVDPFRIRIIPRTPRIRIVPL